MKVVVAVDSLKGSLSSMEAGKAIKEGIKCVDKSIEVVVRPLADGGEGTVEALVEGMTGNYHHVIVPGPLHDLINARYGIIEDKKTAIIEIACAAGITLIENSKRDPMLTTTYGVGKVIEDAIKKGCRRFIIGLGGSATNDGGIGMLQALGFGFLDQDGNQIELGAKGLKNLTSIDSSHCLSELKECEFFVACDVTNPLCGKYGASYIYGPQKGATQKEVKQLDQLLEHLANVTKKYNPDSNATVPGAGAAGGLGFAFLSFLNGTLESGIDLILKETNLESDIKTANLVITGEGQLDKQSVMGKAPIGVAKLAKQYHLPVIAFAGCITKDATICNQEGIDAYFPILRNVTTLQEAMDYQHAFDNMKDTVEQVFRLWNIKK